MKLPILLAITSGVTLAAFAQPFDSGSTGALGDLVVDRPMTVALPPDGVLHYKKVTITPQGVLSFRANALNTPVYLLAQDEVLLQGSITLDGGPGTPAAGGLPGPGGFAGGRPGFAATPPGAGFGPGAGRGGTRDNAANGAGAAGFLTAAGGNSAGRGQAYGNPLLIPLIGGSGGGGVQFYSDWDAGAGAGGGGGGGGGALLIASSKQVRYARQRIGDAIYANGGSGVNGVSNAGSGGAVRIVAPVVTGEVVVSVNGGGPGGGPGRVRVDAVDVGGLRCISFPAAALSIGSVMIARLNPEPTLAVVEAAGTSIPEGTPSPAQITLPTGSDPNRTITVQAKNFGAKIPVEVVLTLDSGPPIVVPAEIDNTTQNPARVAVPVTLPVNVGVTIHAWVRGRP